MTNFPSRTNQAKANLVKLHAEAQLSNIRKSDTTKYSTQTIEAFVKLLKEIVEHSETIAELYQLEMFSGSDSYNTFCQVLSAGVLHQDPTRLAKAVNGFEDTLRMLGFYGYCLLPRNVMEQVCIALRYTVFLHDNGLKFGFHSTELANHPMFKGQYVGGMFLLTSMRCIDGITFLVPTSTACASLAHDLRRQCTIRMILCCLEHNITHSRRTLPSDAAFDSTRAIIELLSDNKIWVATRIFDLFGCDDKAMIDMVIALTSGKLVYRFDIDYVDNSSICETLAMQFNIAVAVVKALHKRGLRVAAYTRSEIDAFKAKNGMHVPGMFLDRINFATPTRFIRKNDTCDDRNITFLLPVDLDIVEHVTRLKFQRLPHVLRN